MFDCTNLCISSNLELGINPVSDARLEREQLNANESEIYIYIKYMYVSSSLQPNS